MCSSDLGKSYKLLLNFSEDDGVTGHAQGERTDTLAQGMESALPCIIDWRLPDMNGIEVTRQIRSLNDDTPIIILTAYDWSDIEVEAKAAGVTAFCSKPMFLSDLRETLMSALGQKLTDASQEILPEKNADFKDRHILLVEDNELNREIAQEILREYGFRVDTAENGEVAVEKVSTAAPGSYDPVSYTHL